MTPAGPLKRSVRFALIQLASGPNKQHNLAHARAQVLQAAANGSDVVVLPECFNSPYGPAHFPAYAEAIPTRFLRQLPARSVPSSLRAALAGPGADADADVNADTDTDADTESPSVAALSAMARDAGTVLIGGSIPEREPATGRLFNTSLVFGPTGALLALHRKVHLFDIDIPGGITFRESDALGPGNALTLVDLPAGLGRVGLGICYDIRFPELAAVLARGTVAPGASEQADGAYAIVFPAAFNMTTGPMHWELLARARAADNQVYVAMCSPARDVQAGYVAYGHSLMVGPDGMVVEQADEKETIVYADLDPAAITKVRQSIPVGTQRRFDVYTRVAAVNQED